MGPIKSRRVRASLRASSSPPQLSASDFRFASVRLSAFAFAFAFASLLLLLRFRSAFFSFFFFVACDFSIALALFDLLFSVLSLRCLDSCNQTHHHVPAFPACFDASVTARLVQGCGSVHLLLLSCVKRWRIFFTFIVLSLLLSYRHHVFVALSTLSRQHSS